ncbi:bifunctional UDP-N-acetylglucosamine diphosphorylase/glucosamine-1-phosphate N-acetyltransferase GlmU [Limnobacter humi]|uniref:Bifunctional protein GlmU n=1 Tax=Limnobacter humi TaxID=1778671 RepID=A0ABT1WCY5_9BURK|nr:bifunctional UDP-N-acetylglucosamine diphosphorylase/glucosamine-1-phosphate N-acetyltransferase GlmU [Limnobacter humi]MCQ8895376.1 bifunctional UDP-N-acetylglucosamine diphosphorylase/glucosamine-1-phosphate N-acetyltransferase GlmU [Limnobacter humi]
MNVLILAAGKGTRMKSTRPKVLHAVAGQSMVERVVRTARHLGTSQTPAHLVVVVGHGAAAVEQHLGSFSELQYALQADQLGTGHAVQCALQQLANHPVTLILYGDVPLIQAHSLQPLIQAAQQGHVGLLTLHMVNPTGYGRILRNTRNQVVGIVEQKDATEAQRAITEINTGILACPTELLQHWVSRLNNHNAQGEYYLTDIIAMAHADGVPIDTAQPVYPWEVSGVNSRQQQAELERIWQLHQADGLMAQGVQLLDPARVDVRGELTCAGDVSIDVGCVFEGTVELGEGVRVGPYCVLSNVRVGAGTRIEAYSHLQDATVGAQAVIGPYARLRPGAQLADEVHIGNFVEVKNATIAKASKANHLAYIGDAIIGERVNVGAGTITCNYDGANKHRTIIEDDVFIGSDTQLVAPVTVKRGATLGAGTTLTKDAPEGSLTVSRAKQVTIDGWKRPVKAPKPSTPQ